MEHDEHRDEQKDPVACGLCPCFPPLPYSLVFNWAPVPRYRTSDTLRAVRPGTTFFYLCHDLDESTAIDTRGRTPKNYREPRTPQPQPLPTHTAESPRERERKQVK